MPNPAKPTALKVLNGSAAKHPERRNPNEPQPEVGGDPPPWLPRRGTAWATWRRLRPIVESMRVMTVADSEALALGCMALQDYLDTPDEHWRKKEAMFRQYLGILTQFGMTPAARQKVSAVPQKAKDPVADWAAK